MNALSTHLHAKREFRRAKRAPSLSPRRARALSAHWWLSAQTRSYFFFSTPPCLLITNNYVPFFSWFSQMASRRHRTTSSQTYGEDSPWDSFQFVSETAWHRYCHNLPFSGRATCDSRVRVPRKEYTQSCYQRLFEENIEKTRKDVVYEL